MEQAKKPLSTWLEQLIHYGNIAFSTGKKLTFRVIKRQDYRKWRIELNDLVSHGEEEFFEED